jgi:hypothetical protein
LAVSALLFSQAARPATQKERTRSLVIFMVGKLRQPDPRVKPGDFVSAANVGPSYKKNRINLTRCELGDLQWPQDGRDRPKFGSLGQFRALTQRLARLADRTG